VNGEYIMEGVVNVKIVDVDPSKRAERQKEATERKLEIKSSTSTLKAAATKTTRQRFWEFIWPHKGEDGRRHCCGLRCCC